MSRTKAKIEECQNCSQESKDLEYCSDCNESLCPDCWNEEGHGEHEE